MSRKRNQWYWRELKEKIWISQFIIIAIELVAIIAAGIVWIRENVHLVYDPSLVFTTSVFLFLFLLGGVGIYAAVREVRS